MRWIQKLPKIRNNELKVTKKLLNDSLVTTFTSGHVIQVVIQVISATSVFFQYTVFRINVQIQSIIFINVTD